MFSVNQSVQFNIEDLNVSPSKMHVLCRRTMRIVFVFLLTVRHVSNKLAFYQI